MTRPTDWRGIAEQLTPRQIDELARFEAFERGDEPAALLSIARVMAAENLAAAVLSTVPAPAGVVAVNAWGDFGGGEWCPHLTRTARRAGPATVAIHGGKSSDGRCERWLCVRDGSELSSELSPAQARELAAVLLDAADEVDHM
jgi:hypothetical protein